MYLITVCHPIVMSYDMLAVTKTGFKWSCFLTAVMVIKGYLTVIISSNFISYHCLSPSCHVLWHGSCHKDRFQMILFSDCCDDNGYKRLSYCCYVYLISVCHLPMFPINVFSDRFGDYGRISQVFLFLFWTQPCLWLVTLSSTLPPQASRTVLHPFLNDLFSSSLQQGLCRLM